MLKWAKIITLIHPQQLSTGPRKHIPGKAGFKSVISTPLKLTSANAILELEYFFIMNIHADKL